MKEVRRVIDRKEFPKALPLSLTISSIIALDYWEVSIFLCIIVYVILFWFWLDAIYHLRTDVLVKILWQPKDFEQPESKKEPKLSFKERREMADLVEKEAKDKSKLL